MNGPIEGRDDIIIGKRFFDRIKEGGYSGNRSGIRQVVGIWWAVSIGGTCRVRGQVCCTRGGNAISINMRILIAITIVAVLIVVSIIAVVIIYRPTGVKRAIYLKTIGRLSIISLESGLTTVGSVEGVRRGGRRSISLHA